MRVTSNSFSDSLVHHLQTMTRRQASLQTQIASGQRVQDASDDPLAAQQILGLRDQSVATAQFQKNIQVNQEFARNTSGTLQSLQKLVDRAQEIAVTVDGLDSKEDLSSYGAEVNELLKQALQLANTEYRGEYIFAGTKSSEAAFTPTLTNGKISSVEFQGNSTPPATEVAPGVTITSRLAGDNRSGSGEAGVFGDSRSGADLFSHLIAFRDRLLAGDAAGIQSQTRGDLGKDEENILFHIAGNGALQSRLETMMGTSKDLKNAVEGDLSRRADVDLSDVVVRLSQQQTAYQATLQSAGAVMNLTLLTYLR